MYVARQAETGLLSQLVDAAAGGPEKRARAAAALQDAEAARLERERLDKEIAVLQQLIQQKGLGQATQAAAYLQELKHQQALLLEQERQRGNTKILIGVTAAGVVAATLWLRRHRRT
jgi:hypothetical protein